MPIQPLSKYGPSGLSWREEKHARKRDRQKQEEAAKLEAKHRDGYRCRWPHCEHKHLTQPLEGAHLDGKGMGGNRDGSRNVAANIVTLCYEHHRGRVSLHSGDLKIEPMTAAGADGPLSFWKRDPDDRWYQTHREVGIGVAERD